MNAETQPTKINDESNVISLKQRRALQLVRKGVAKAVRGKVDEAAAIFKSSVEICPTSEGYTYWGWMLSFKGDLDEAIRLCKLGIDTDPSFGNPYNDIGTYLMKKNELDRAIPWLERAKTAERFEPKHFPYLNLGRIYLSQFKFMKALREFDVALTIDPENEELRTVANRLRTRLNEG